RSGIAIGSVDTSVGQADIVHDGGDLALGHLASDLLLNFIHQTGSFLDTQTGTRAHMQPHLPGIDAGEKITAKKKDQPAGENTEPEKDASKKSAMFHDGFKRVAVGTAKALEQALKPRLKPPEDIGRRLVGIVFVTPQQVHDERGNEGSRKQVRRQHGEDNRFSQGNEQITRYTGQEKHRHKYDADAERRYKGRNRDLLCA